MPAITIPHGADMTPRAVVPPRQHYAVVYTGRTVQEPVLNSHVIDNMRRRVSDRRRALGFEGNKRATVDIGMKRGHVPSWWAHAVPGANAAAAAAEGQFI